MWFALDGEKTEYEYSYNYQNWYPSAEYETNNTIKKDIKSGSKVNKTELSKIVAEKF